MPGNIKQIDAHGKERIRCDECHASGEKSCWFHILSAHVTAEHNLKPDDYLKRYPGQPLLSQHAMNGAANARAAAAKGKMSALATEAERAVPEILQFGVAKLPVRRGLGATDLALVPRHDGQYELEIDKLEAAALAIQERENQLAVGPTGAGKSTFYEELASILNQPLRRVNLHGDVRAADFIGEKVVDVDPESGQAVVTWKDGILPDSMRKGHWLLIDELDAGRPDILFILQAALEPSRRLVLTANHGEVVNAHPEWRVIATANTLGRGDDSGLYTGTNILNEAFLDRFGTVIQWEYLPPEKEGALLVLKTKIAPAIAQKMVECAKLVRSGLETEDCYCTFSTRRLIAWARKTVALTGTGPTKGLHPHWRAAQLTIFNKLSGDDRKYVEGIIQRTMGGGSK